MNQDTSIPNHFHSDSDEQPFAECKVCSKPLDSNTTYVIEKAYKRLPDGEDVTLFELAICISCAEKQAKKMSKESRATIERLMGSQDFFEKRQARWLTDWKSDWTERCIFSDNEIQPNDEFHIVGHFKGNEILPYQTPFLIGQKMLESLQEELSLETKEELDNFGKQFLGPDPRLKLLLEDYQFVMV